jgi:hypothetical protein
MFVTFFIKHSDKGGAVDTSGDPEGVEEQFPGWHAWNVRLPDGTVSWYARPFPLVSASSVDELRAEIRMAHQTREANWPSLASFEDYASRAPGFREDIRSL